METPFTTEADYDFEVNDLTGNVYYYDKNNPEGGLTRLGSVGPKKKAGDDLNQWEQINAEIQAGKIWVQDKLGSDGKLSPKDFKELRDLWAYDDKSFVENFKRYVDMNHFEDYGLSAEEVY